MEYVDESRVHVFLMCGFLESGKSEFLAQTMDMDYFKIKGTTVLILCEEGEVEFDQDLLKRTNTVMVTTEPEKITPSWLQAIDNAYHPQRVIFECNGMYPVSKMESMVVPEGWGLVQKICTVDASTFDLYLANMKSLFNDMVTNAEMVVFNRCTEDMPLAAYRRSVKVVSPSAEIIFESEEGEIENIFDEQMPYDLDAPVVQIEDMDYGIWYIDMIDNPDRYDGKVVEFQGKILKPRRLASDEFIVGRMAMTCCADDTTFLGQVCKSKHAGKLKAGQWIRVRGRVAFEYHPAYRAEGPVIYLEHGTGIPALEDEMVYFN